MFFPVVWTPGLSHCLVCSGPPFPVVWTPALFSVTTKKVAARSAATYLIVTAEKGAGIQARAKGVQAKIANASEQGFRLGKEQQANILRRFRCAQEETPPVVPDEPKAPVRRHAVRPVRSVYVQGGGLEGRDR